MQKIFNTAAFRTIFQVTFNVIVMIVINYLKSRNARPHEQLCIIKNAFISSIPTTMFFEMK